MNTMKVFFMQSRFRPVATRPDGGATVPKT
jgi:hypothetical protein